MVVFNRKVDATIAAIIAVVGLMFVLFSFYAMHVFKLDKHDDLLCLFWVICSAVAFARAPKNGRMRG
jgi:hypothetical protein